MKRTHLVVAMGLVGAAGLLAGCQAGKSGEDKDLRYYLGQNGRLYKWEDAISQAVCQLEKNVTGLDPAKRLCPSGQYPPSGTPPPYYPPH